MPVLTRYDICCHVLPDRRGPFDAKITYYTGAPFSRQRARYDEIDREKDVISEFWNKARAVNIWWTEDIYEIHAAGHETQDVTGVKNDPVEFFVRKEDITKTFEVPAGTTQIMIYIDDVYMWRDGELLNVEGKMPTSRPRLLGSEPIAIIEYLCEKDKKKK